MIELISETRCIGCDICVTVCPRAAPTRAGAPDARTPARWTRLICCEAARSVSALRRERHPPRPAMRYRAAMSRSPVRANLASAQPFQ